jgi:predicted dehydrogenase
MRAFLIGCGNHGGEVLLPAALEADIQIAGVIDPDLARAKALAARWSIPAVYPRLDDAPTNTVDAAIIAVPVMNQAAQVRAAIERQLHVFVEKPPAASLAELESLIKAVEGSGLACRVGMNFRCAEGVQVLQRRVQSGQHGAPRYVRVVQIARKPLTPFSPQLSLESSLFFAQGIHAVDLAFAFTPGATMITGQRIGMARGTMCVLVGEDPVNGSRMEASFGSSAAGLYHQLEVVCDSGDVLQLRDLAELHHLPNGGDATVSDYPGARVVWRRSPTSTGFAVAGYAVELAAFRAHVGGAHESTADGADLIDLLPAYQAYDQLLNGWGTPWTR